MTEAGDTKYDDKPAFLRLPGEIQNKICVFAVVTDASVSLHAIRHAMDGTQASGKSGRLNQPSLLSNSALIWS